MSASMCGKAPMKVLQDYCARKWFPFPTYEVFLATDGSKTYVCTVTAVGESAGGIGKSKLEAEQKAAANLIEELQGLYPSIKDILYARLETTSVSDAVTALRDLCLRENHPFPTFDIERLAGSPKAPLFRIECRVGRKVRKATASTIDGARQLAAHRMSKTIQRKPLEQVAEEFEELELNNIKMYQEFKEANIKNPPSTRSIDRYNLELEKRSRAYYILHDSSITSSKDKVEWILKMLEILYKIEEFPAIKGDSILFVSLYCNLDVVFVGKRGVIFDDIIDYFQHILC